jgi:hypothetical protein
MYEILRGDRPWKNFLALLPPELFQEVRTLGSFPYNSILLFYSSYNYMFG